MDEMTDEQRKLARHALGLDNPASGGKSYRNRYFAGRGHSAWSALHDMVGKGWVNLEDVRGETLFTMNRRGAEMVLEKGETLDPEDFAS